MTLLYGNTQRRFEKQGSAVTDHFGYQGDVMIAAPCHLRIPVDGHFRFLNFRFWWF